MTDDILQRRKYERRQTRMTGAIIALLLFFGFYSIYQRSTNTAEIKQTTLIQRSVLNARARVTVIMITAQMEGRYLTPAEMDEIQSLWKQAEYDKATPPEQR